MVRTVVLSLLAALMAVAPVAAQTPEAVPIGTIDRATVMYERFTLIGLAGFRVTVGEIDGSVPDPVDVYMAAALESAPGLVEASPPKHGDVARMLTGTQDEIELAIVMIQDGSYIFLFVGSGVAAILGDFLPLVDTLMQRPVTTLEEWLPTLADMPAGFTLSEGHSSPAS